MIGQSQSADRTLRQAVSEKSVLDHLVHTFSDLEQHGTVETNESFPVGAVQLYSQIRREWSPESRLMLAGR